MRTPRAGPYQPVQTGGCSREVKRHRAMRSAWTRLDEELDISDGSTPCCAGKHPRCVRTMICPISWSRPPIPSALCCRRSGAIPLASAARKAQSGDAGSNWRGNSLPTATAFRFGYPLNRCGSDALKVRPISVPIGQIASRPSAAISGVPLDNVKSITISAPSLSVSGA